jgi:hypothetical protein
MPIKVEFKKSPIKTKKLRAIFYEPTKDGYVKIKHTDFGARGYKDFIIYNKEDGKIIALEKRKKYIARHKKNENWNDFMSAGSLSKYILWNKKTLKASIADYKKRFNLK